MNSQPFIIVMGCVITGLEFVVADSCKSARKWIGKKPRGVLGIYDAYRADESVQETTAVNHLYCKGKCVYERK